MGFASIADTVAIENEMPWSAREVPVTLNQMLGFVPRMKEAAHSFAKTFHTPQDTPSKEE